MQQDRMRCFGLIANLPTNSRLSEEELGGPVLGHRDQVLMAIEYWLHSWVYAHSDDAKKKKNVPELMMPDYIINASNRAKLEEMERTTPESIREYIYGATFN